MNMRNDKLFHVISNTHWDREWRFPFQRNRMMLVDMIDAVLQILDADPEYRAFHLDSQSVVLTDYLEVRPQNREKISAYVEQKRLFIGPWFILPDEFLVGGENLIRNLLLGHKICNTLGGVSKIGYSPFSWGQISQLPQLYQQFGVELIMFYRGINSLESHNAEFIWEGADGTKALSSRFSTMPRYNFYFYIYRPVIHNEGFGDVAYTWEKGGTPFHFADPYQYQEDYFILNPVDSYYRDNIRPSVETIIEKQADDFTTEHVIWMEGHDSSGPNAKTVRIIKDIQNEFPGIRVVHSTLEEYAAGLSKAANRDELPVVSGERRSAQYDLRSGNLYGYVTSARTDIKLANFRAENRLQFYAEPFYTLAGILGMDTNTQYLNIAWNYLVQNSTHDSIGGCSLDAIHQDMHWRYKQVEEIAKGVFERATKFIAANLNHYATDAFNNPEPEKDIFLTIFNPVTHLRHEIAEAIIDIPKSLESDSLALMDANGEVIPVTILEAYDEQPVLEQMTNRPMYFDMKRYKVLFETPAIPSLGYTTLKVIPRLQAKMKGKGVVEKKDGIHTLENTHLKVVIRKNGTFDLHDKSGVRKFKGLGLLLDEGEAGHAWVHTPVSPEITSEREKPKIKITENTPHRGVCQIEYKLHLPKNLKERGKLKSGSKKEPKMVKVPVTVKVILEKNARSLKLQVSVNNKALDHRLRILFPGTVAADHHYAEGQFDIVRRPIKRTDDEGNLVGEGWVEQPMHDYPLHHFMALSDGSDGLGIITNGIKEYEVLDNHERTIAFTLLRAFRYVIQPSSKQDYGNNEGSQSFGEHKYQFVLYPFSSGIDGSGLYEEALRANLPVSIVQTGGTHGTLPVEQSFVSINASMVQFSALKDAESHDGSKILRLYNPSELSETIELTFFRTPVSVHQCTLEEIDSVPILAQDNHVTLEIGAKKILTLRLRF